MRMPGQWEVIATAIVLPLFFPFGALSASEETEHFTIRGDIPAGRLEEIYAIFEKRIFTPRGAEVKIPVRTDRSLRSAGLDGKAYADHIGLASFSEKTFIHELAHFLWEIRGWTPRPWLAEERERLRRRHPLIREEFLNHYLIYEHIVPRVEALLGDPSLEAGEGGQRDDMAEGGELTPDG